MLLTKRSIVNLLWASAFFSFGAIRARGQAPVSDYWSPKSVLRTADGWYAVPAHATLLPDGRLFFIGYERDTEDPAAATDARRGAFTLTPTPINQTPPAEVVVDGLVEPVDAPDIIAPPYFISDDLFCTGHSLTADGLVFTAGGTRNVLDLTTGGLFTLGLQYATISDGDGWARLAVDMEVAGTSTVVGRWYPSVTRLADGRMLVTSGYDVVQPLPTTNVSAEVFDFDTGLWETVAQLGEPPAQIFNGDYTHPAVLPAAGSQPGGALWDLLMFGQAGVPVFFDLDGNWAVSNQGRPGTLPGETPNHGATSALLPLRVTDGEWGYRNGSMLVTAGQHMTSHMQHADVYDPIADAWLPRVDTTVMRHHPTAVLLPDGQVLVVAGHNAAGDDELRQATYLDPANEFAVGLGNAAMGELRGYHNVALLLPDGRVLVGGGRGADTATTGEKADYRYLYPPYLFGPRPAIVSAPAVISYGQPFAVESSGPVPDDVVLMSLGSMTHSYDFNQRYVQLASRALRSAQGQVASVADPSVGTGGAATTRTLAEAPASPTTAPPGHYMLFVLDEDRVPSIARIVRLQ